LILAVIVAGFVVFQNLFPARGRKHAYPCSRRSKLQPRWFFRTYSPQGDGNVEYDYFLTHHNPKLRGGFSEPIPRKGTETELLQNLRQYKLLCFSEPIPRKGTETFIEDSSNSTIQIVFQNLFPARGRKPERDALRMANHTRAFFRTYSPQGDGNIRSVINPLGSDAFKFFRTYSPQGDGNFFNFWKES